MSEREHFFENRENQEQQLIRLLKEKGVEDLEAKKLLIKWNDEQEKIVEQSTGINYRKAQINFELKKGQLFLAAGYIDESLDNLKDALFYAEQEGFEDLCQIAKTEIQKIENPEKE